jgi:hypothetical protein
MKYYDGSKEIYLEILTVLHVSRASRPLQYKKVVFGMRLSVRMEERTDNVRLASVRTVGRVLSILAI